MATTATPKPTGRAKKSTESTTDSNESQKAAAKKTAKSTEKKEKAANKGPADKNNNSGSTATSKDFIPYEAAPDEEYMSPSQLKHFEEMLRKWKQDLMEEVDRTVHHMQDESANLPDPADRASQEEEFTFELRTRDRERKLLKKIDQAIESIEQKEYGYCESCGVEIGIRRLEARPTATLCIDCKTLDEIKEKQLRR